MLRKLIAEFKRRRELHRQLENLTDPHFLTVAEMVSDYERQNPGHYVTRRGIENLRRKLEA